MSDMSKIAIIKELLDSANSKIQNARKLLSQISGDVESVSNGIFLKKASDLNSTINEGEKIIEGVFNGEEMIDSESNTYPVPANYASKSKLVSGDLLKLTIAADGRFIYKQIGPTKRKYLVGPLSYEEGQYKVFSSGVAYKVLLASVTYFKAEIGDEITIIIPEDEKSEWAAIDAVLPKVQNVINDEEKKEDNTSSVI